MIVDEYQDDSCSGERRKQLESMEEIFEKRVWEAVNWAPR